MADPNAGGRKKLFNSQGEYGKLGNGLQAAAGDGKAKASDEQLDEGRHNRGYNPLDQAEKGRVCDKLNHDSGRYRKGPGPT